MRFSLTLSITLLVSSFTHAAPSGEMRGIPNFHYDLPAYSLHHFVLGNSCLSLPASQLDLDCNPAMMAKEEKRQFRVNVVLNDRVKQVNEYREKLQNSDTSGIVNSVLEQKEPLLAKASSALWYQDGWWAAGVVPARIGFGSVVRNPAYPEIAAHVYKDTEVFGKLGLLVADAPAWRIGAQARYVDRQFFRNEFALFDATADASLLKIESTRALYLEPGVSYTWESAWPTSVSASLTQLPVFQYGARNPVSPVFDLGFSTTPGFADGKWRTTTHYTHRRDQLDFFKSFLWGTTYEFNEKLAASLSLGKAVFAIGLSGRIDSLVLGLGYKTEELEPDYWQTTRVSTTLLELGLAF